LNLNNLIGKIIQAFFEIIDGIIVDIGFEFHQNNMIDHISFSLCYYPRAALLREFSRFSRLSPLSPFKIEYYHFFTGKRANGLNQLEYKSLRLPESWIRPASGLK
jgi:hypothetical protein